MTSTSREERRAAFLALPRPVHARYLAVGGAHVRVEGVASDRTLCTVCEACGQLGGFYLPTEFRTDRDLLLDAMHAAEKHAATCRRIPERLWPENVGGAL